MGVPQAMAAAFAAILLGPFGARAADDAAITGRIVYRAGRKREVKGDRGARVLLFRGEEKLALESAARLRDFEKRFPDGLKRAEDRPVEDAARAAAIVLSTYEELHADVLAAKTRAAADGSFRLEVSAPGRYTLLVESAAASGSYHLKRYDARVLEIGEAAMEPARIDFGVSHFERGDHAAPPRRPRRRGEAPRRQVSGGTAELDSPSGRAGCAVAGMFVLLRGYQRRPRPPP